MISIYSSHRLAPSDSSWKFQLSTNRLEDGSAKSLGRLFDILCFQLLAESVEVDFFRHFPEEVYCLSGLRQY